jgi:phosphoglycolate phosphatase
MTGDGQESPMRLVLWDIDRTLVDARSSGEDWYRKALAQATGQTLRCMPDTAGRTELAITTEVLETHGIEVRESSIDAMFTALAFVVAEERDGLSLYGSAMPGAAQALMALGTKPGVVQSLVTGNLPDVAFYKLDAFGLHRHVEFDIGGFGADSVHRHELIAASVTKANEKHGGTFDPSSVVVVGDTPHDVAAARRFGAVAIAVATGRSFEDELRAAGAHVVLPDLTDTDAVLDAVVTGKTGDNGVRSRRARS